MSVLSLDVDQLEQFADAIAERLRQPAEPQPLAVDVNGACRLLGVSWDYWAEHVASEVRIVRKGRRKLVPIAELERWLAENSTAVLDRTRPRSRAEQ